MGREYLGVSTAETITSVGTIRTQRTSTLAVISYTLTANLYLSVLIQTADQQFMNIIQGGVLQQNHEHPHYPVVIQHSLYGDDALIC
ncbi:hypothetical protein TNCV_1938581 [Trichonephila clavipes]|nr:hypothetical protein TNCV_1938581 [Trichonephila clavipes]